MIKKKRRKYRRKYHIVLASKNLKFFLDHKCTIYLKTPTSTHQLIKSLWPLEPFHLPVKVSLTPGNSCVRLSEVSADFFNPPDLLRGPPRPAGGMKMF